MPARSSNFAGGRFLRREVVIESLRRSAARLRRDNPEVMAVLLFESLARGDFGLRSDADLLLCLRTSSERRPADRIPGLLAAFLEAPVPVDILPLTESEILMRLQDPRPFWTRIWNEALLLEGTLPASLETITQN